MMARFCGIVFLVVATPVFANAGAERRVEEIAFRNADDCALHQPEWADAIGRSNLLRNPKVHCVGNVLTIEYVPRKKAPDRLIRSELLPYDVIGAAEDIREHLSNKAERPVHLVRDPYARRYRLVYAPQMYRNEVAYYFAVPEWSAIPTFVSKIETLYDVAVFGDRAQKGVVFPSTLRVHRKEIELSIPNEEGDYLVDVLGLSDTSGVAIEMHEAIAFDVAPIDSVRVQDLGSFGTYESLGACQSAKSGELARFKSILVDGDSIIDLICSRQNGYYAIRPPAP